MQHSAPYQPSYVSAARPVEYSNYQPITTNVRSNPTGLVSAHHPIKNWDGPTTTVLGSAHGGSTYSVSPSKNLLGDRGLNTSGWKIWFMIHLNLKFRITS